MKAKPTACFLFRPPGGALLAAFVLTALVSTVVWAASAPPGRTQRLASPDAVPEGLSAADWSGIRQQYEQHRHRAVSVEGGHEARNPGQQWLTRFDGRGFLTRPEAGGWQWGLELQSYGFAGYERAVTGPLRVSADGQRVTYDWDAMLQEWFVNDRRGLEHGFTVRERPPFPEPRSSRREEAQYSPPKDQSLLTSAATVGEVAALTFTLAVRGGLRPEVETDGRGVRFVDAQGAVALTYTGLTVRDADGRALAARLETVPGRADWPKPAVMGENGSPTPQRREATAHHQYVLRLAVEESGARYPLTIDPLAQQAYLKASNTDPGDQFGFSVAVSGDTVVVGAPGEDSNATGVGGDEDNNSVPVAGAAYVFVRNRAAWSQQAYLKASNTGAQDYFGYSVAVSGESIVVGAPYEDSNATGVNGNETNNSVSAAGAAYVFVRNGTTWTQQAYLKASNTGTNDHFGWSVAMSGNTVVVGAPNEASSATGVNGDESDNSAANSGAAYVFVRDDTTWSQQAYLKASNTGFEDYFGWSVAASGDAAVIGAYWEDSNATGVDGNGSDNSAANSGAAYVFVRSGKDWSQEAYLKASNTDPQDQFGVSVAVSGGTVVIGARNESSSATGVNGDEHINGLSGAGAAYVFVRSGTNWNQEAYLKASNTGRDGFASTVAISGDAVIVGASGEDSNATGINGNQNNESATAAGAAYLFVRLEGSWNQVAYLKASNTGINDRFANCVAVSGDTVVVGAYQEDSDATGVDGSGTDPNENSNSGAAYAFGFSSRGDLGPDGSGGYFIGFDGFPGFTYRVERAGSLGGPWDTVDTQVAPLSGLMQFHDTTPLSARGFYRTVRP